MRLNSEVNTVSSKAFERMSLNTLGTTGENQLDTKNITFTKQIKTKTSFICIFQKVIYIKTQCCIQQMYITNHIHKMNMY